MYVLWIAGEKGEGMSISAIRASLLSWFAVNARAMAWRSDPTPWHVWVSEIMLQQTRVESVHGYFERFMKRFPSPSHVAVAPIEDVLDAWAGLGYYSRARNLHHACTEIDSEYGGVIPDDPELFGALKGVGRYTRGAVMSIAFNQPEPIVDGNVERVFSRLFLVEDNVRSPNAKKRFWSLAEQFVADLDTNQLPGDINQAIMELGALVCKPKAPSCADCPLTPHCLAFGEGKAHKLPIKAKAAPKKTVRLKAYVCTDEDARIWVVRRPEKGVLAGLWSLPMVEIEKDARFTLAEPPITQIKHAFTHLIWLIDVYRLPTPKRRPDPNWGETSTAMSASELAKVALGGPSLKALIAAGIDLPKRRGSGA